MGPTHELAWVQALVRARKRWITGTATRTAIDCGLVPDDAFQCVLELSQTDFHKTMESEQRPGVWLDVYKPEFVGLRIYLKLQVEDGEVGVVSFKEA